MSYVRSPLTFVPPQLPSLIDQPPEGHEWLHEVKNDGFRTQLLIERGKARAYTRTGIDGATVFLVVLHAARLPCRSAILDGEVVVLDKRGASDFEALQATLRSRSAPAPLFAFDLLHHDGKDYRAVALRERRERLKELLDSDPKSVLQFSEEFVGDATAFFRACAEHRLEGMVSKLASSTYRSGRSKTWLKTKCFTESEFILLGIDRDRKTRALRALLAKPSTVRSYMQAPHF